MRNLRPDHRDVAVALCKASLGECMAWRRLLRQSKRVACWQRYAQLFTSPSAAEHHGAHAGGQCCLQALQAEVRRFGTDQQAPTRVRWHQGEFSNSCIAAGASLTFPWCRESFRCSCPCTMAAAFHHSSFAMRQNAQPRTLHQLAMPLPVSDESCLVQGLLQLLETGEAPEAQQPPGLTVPLRPYQRQSLKFMQDAEACQGGFGSHLWAKVDFGSTTFWWSPIIKRATLQDPACDTRGGFLAGAGCFPVLSAVARPIAQKSRTCTA